MERQNKDGVWKNAEKLVEFIWFSLCFYFVRRGREGWRELTRQSFETKTDDTGARYVGTIWPCVLIIMINDFCQAYSLFVSLIQ